jgi:hypothetical protein
MVLTFLKSKLPEESFAKVSSAIPETQSLMSDAAEKGEHESEGLIGAVKGAVGKILGGGSTDALLTKFGQLGLSAQQIEGFLPKVMEFLKSKLPGNVMNQVSGLLPTPHEAAH